MGRRIDLKTCNIFTPIYISLSHYIDRICMHIYIYIYRPVAEQRMSLELRSNSYGAMGDMRSSAS